MPTYIKAGLFDPNCVRSEQNEFINPEIYIDDILIQVIDDNSMVVLELTCEELTGIIAIMSAEKEKKHTYLSIASKKN